MRGQQGGGLGLLQDTQLIETLAHFSRERIPERYVSIDFMSEVSFRLISRILQSCSCQSCWVSQLSSGHVVKLG